jgi:hypothetical protein
MKNISDNYIDISKIDLEQDKKISNLLRIEEEASFEANPQDLLDLHKTVIVEEEQQFFAGIWRTLPSHA